MQVEYDLFCQALVMYPHRVNEYRVVCCGVGKASAVASFVDAIHNESFDLVVVVGFAAGSSDLRLGDFVMPSRCAYSDVSVPCGLVPELERVHNLPGRSGVLLLTADSFIDKERAIELQSKYGCSLLFDMESAAVVQVAGRFVGCPVWVIKTISDRPAVDAPDQFTRFVDSKPDFVPFIDIIEHVAFES